RKARGWAGSPRRRRRRTRRHHHRRPPGWPPAPPGRRRHTRARSPGGPAAGSCSAVLPLLDHSEAITVGQLEELGVDAAERLLAVLVRPFDLGRADRQRLAHGPDRAEPISPAAATLEVLLIDRDREDALRAAGVAPAVGLIGVQKRAGLLQTALRVDHHLAYHPALAAFDLGLALDHRKLLLDVPHRLQSTRGLGWGNPRSAARPAD